MKAEWLASASLALAGVCLGLNMSQPVWNAETEQFDNNPSKGMGLLLGGGMVIGGAVMAKRSAGGEPALVRKVQPKAAKVQAIAPTPVGYDLQPQIKDFTVTEQTPDIEDIEIEESQSMPVVVKNSLETAIDYTLSRTGAGVIISSLTNSGKTTFLYAYLAEILRQTNGAAHISVIDAKGSTWAGLEQLQERDGTPRVLVTGNKAGDARKNTVDAAIEKINLFETIRSERADQRMLAEAEGHPYNPAPAILVIDEWVAFISLLGRAASGVISNVNNLFFLGREDGVFVVLTGQSHRCGILKIESGCRDNILLIGLNSTKDLKSIDAMISDSWVIQSEGTRIHLIQKLSWLKNRCDRVSYCSYGHILEPMPALSKKDCYDQLKRCFSSSNVVAFKPKAEPQKDELLTDYWA